MKLATWLSMLLLMGLPLPGKPSVTFVVKFLAEALLSFGVDQLLNGLTPDDSDNDLDSIVNSLSRIEKNIQDVKISIEELKDIPTLYEAEKLERQLLVLFQEAVTVTKAINRIGRVSNSSEQHGQLRAEVATMKNNLKKIPTILVELHSLIVGNSVVSGKRSLGLACSYIQFTFTKLQTVSSTTYNLNNILKQINNHRDSLMRMQVNSFQLYNGTCVDREVICNVQMEQLEDRLLAQSQRFEECVPRQVAHLARKSNLDDINIIHPESKHVLYSTQQASIIVDGVMDWEKVDSPQDAGLKCPEGNDSEIWSFQTAAIHGRGGYYLRQKSGCYLGFDRAFVTFDNILPLFWTQSDRINRKEFLICLPLNSSDVARFLLLPSAAEINTTYDLKEVETGEFLNVHVKKTSVHDEIDHRLILVLFLNKEKSNSWMIVQRPGDSLPCTELGTSIPDVQDGSYLAIIIGPIVAVVVLVLLGVGVWCRWRKKNECYDDTVCGCCL